jgi:hypothetical protein
LAHRIWYEYQNVKRSERLHRAETAQSLATRKQEHYNMNTLTTWKPLTTEQYDKCRQAALERVQKRIGSRPVRKDFERDAGRAWTVLDLVALVVFLAALWISSVHIVTHTGMLAQTSYTGLSQATAGIYVSDAFYAVTHQVGLIALAEGSMILFLVLFGMMRSTWRRIVFLALALAAFETASQDASKHAEYMPLLRQEIWQKLAAMKANQDYIDAPAAFKHQAVNRELERDSWSYEHTLPIGNTSPVSAIADMPMTPIGVNEEAEPTPFLAIPPSANGSGKLHGASVGINNV